MAPTGVGDWQQIGSRGDFGQVKGRSGAEVRSSMLPSAHKEKRL